MDKKQLAILIRQYLNNQASPEEKKLLENWFYQESRKTSIDEIDGSFLFLKQEIWNKILKETDTTSHKKVFYYRILEFAAVIMLCIGLLFLYNHIHKTTRINGNAVTLKTTNPIIPGANKAVLTLPDGKSINLSTAQTGIIISDKKVAYNNGSIVAENSLLSGDAGTPQNSFAELSVPRGGQYNVILGDGTKVWLNAASNLKYPIKFTGSKRMVQLNGEAYFEVAKDQAHPFIVKTVKQQTEVLGTHFNINAYEDENTTKTTLLEGSIRVTSTDPSMNGSQVVLSPGQEADLSDRTGISVKIVDADEAIAWQKGYFEFNYADIESVMRQISRWYNVEIEYQGSVPKKAYSGRISRNVNAQELINMLNYMGIKCRIENNKIIVNS